MHYSIKQLSNQRWGIYWESKLLASFGSYEKSLAIFKILQSNYERQSSAIQSQSFRATHGLKSQGTLRQKTSAIKNKVCA